MTATLSSARDADATRTSILSAGLDLFAEEGFDTVGVRAIGARAGVDPALINRYFGGKDELFVQVIKSGSADWRRLWGSRDGFPERVAEDILSGSKGGTVLRGLIVLMRSVGSEKAKRLICEAFGDDGLHELENWVGGKDADVRARLLMGFLAGMAIIRDLTSDLDLEGERSAALRAQIQSTVSYFLTAPA